MQRKFGTAISCAKHLTQKHSVRATTMSSSSPVLIVGSGVGGLVLAHALQKHSIPFRIFERDPSLNYRTQGYRFHLGADGPPALYACLSEETKAKLRLCSPSSNDITKNAQLLDGITGDPIENWTGMKPTQHRGQTPLNLDRGSMRRALSEDLPVEFGKAFKSFEIEADGVKVHFTDNTTARGSLLVGADGARSRVRAQLLPDYKFLDTEGRWIWGRSNLTPQLRAKISPKKMDFGITALRNAISPDIATLILMEAICFDRSIDNPFVDTLPPDYVYWVVQLSRKVAKVDDNKFLHFSSDDASQFAATMTSHLIPEVRAIIEHHNEGDVAAQFVLSGDPKVPQYDGQGRVTLLGDAIHSMPPTAGLGATSAIQDAEWLAEALVDAGGRVTRKAVDKYEIKMRGNGREAIASSEDKSTKMFGAPSFREMRRVSA